jgi:subtilase family serine protease
MNIKKAKNITLAVGLVLIGFTGTAVNILTIEKVSASARTFDEFEAVPPIHTLAGSGATTLPQGLSPAQTKTAYHFPANGGSGTIVIISAFKHPATESDLAAFDKQFKLAACTVANKCLEIHDMSSDSSGNSGKSSRATNAGWDLESALDTEWAHAIAPKAKILLVEAVSASGANLMKAVDYARGRAGVVSVSMSWGGAEFSGETALDAHFTTTNVAFFASSGDDGAGASWPAVAANVIAVGGTSLSMTTAGVGKTSKFLSEKAWSGSGGGVSMYETEPAYQKTYSIPQAGGHRAIPDVSYAADPAHGFSVYHLGAAAKNTAGWYVIGGTSAGAPQWAALATLGVAVKHPITLSELYKDKASLVYAKFFRDITSGTNGTCAYYCAARTHYDYVTGLGSPITDAF